MADAVRHDFYQGAATKRERPEGFVPTLFLGVGGSGKDVVMRLRRRFYEEYGAPRAGFVRSIIVDTDMQPQAFVPHGDPPEAYGPALIPEPGERVNCEISAEQFNKTFLDLEHGKQTIFSDWLKRDMRELGPEAVQNGCGTHRQFGRMALFNNIQTLRETINREINAALAFPNKRNEHKDDPVLKKSRGEIAKNEIEVVIVSSLAGGTGAGMVIDMAYLVKDILSRKDCDTFITLICFLPSVFKKEKSDSSSMRHQQNAYASLLELEYYGTPRSGDELFLGRSTESHSSARVGFRAPWRKKTDDRDNFIEGAGWEACYLIDAANPQRTKNPLTRSEVFQMTADYLFLDFQHSDFAQKKRSARSNNVQFRDRRVDSFVLAPQGDGQPQDSLWEDENVLFATHQGCTFSSFGLAEITFDRDRVFRAAGYRLAMHLVMLKWLGRAGDVADPVYNDWTTQDLFKPTAAAENKPPPSFMPVQLMGLLYEGDKGNWCAQANQEFQSLATKPFNSGSAPLRGAMGKHAALLSGSSSGEKGRARQTLDVKVEQLSGTPGNLGVLRERLSNLGRYYANRHGVAVTIKLLERYRLGLEQAGQEAEKLKGGGQNPGDILARLDEAATVPFPARKLALKIEYPRACQSATSYIQQNYRAASADYIRRLEVAASTYIGSPEMTPPPELARWGTVHEKYDRYRSFLEELGGHLRMRFDELCSTAGTNRKKLLFTSNWDSSTYDNKINRSLLNTSIVGKPSDAGKSLGSFEFDFSNVEKRVLEKLRKQYPTYFTDQVDSLSELLDSWWKYQEHQPGGVARVAETLGDACKELLDDTGLDLEDHADGNVVDLLCGDSFAEQRKNLIENLVDSAASYLPAGRLEDVQDFSPVFTNLLGLEVGDAQSPGSVRNLNIVQTEIVNQARNSQSNFDTNDIVQGNKSSILVCRETTGIPLQYFKNLEDLHDAYHSGSDRGSDECHLDYHETWEDLPDVRILPAKTYGLIQRNIHQVLMAMINGTIYCDDGVFYVRVRDDHALGSVPHRLGTRINRLVKHACEKSKVLSHIERSNKLWEKRASPKDWGLLYLATSRTYLGSRNPPVEGRLKAAPLQNCASRLMTAIRKSLKETEDGRRWINHFTPPDEFEELDYEKAKESYDSLIDNVMNKDRVISAIKAGIPIYQVNWKLIDKVQLPSEGQPGDESSKST